MARKELNFNMSGEVNDETAQKIGRFLGAQVVVFGYIKPMGNTVRFKVCAITVETAEILGIYMENIKKGDITGTFGKEPEPPEPPKPSIDIDLWRSNDTYAYIRGAVAVLPDDDSGKLELYYDYGIDSGYKLGIKYIIRFMELF
jgi:hypothetical protein